MDMQSKKPSLKEIIEADYKSLKKGTISPDKAFRIFSVFQVMNRMDEKGKVKKSLLNFYSTLKKQYPEIAAFMVEEETTTRR